MKQHSEHQHLQPPPLSVNDNLDDAGDTTITTINTNTNSNTLTGSSRFTYSASPSVSISTPEKKPPVDAKVEYNTPARGTPLSVYSVSSSGAPTKEKIQAQREGEVQQRSLLNACIIVLTVTMSMIINTANSTAVSIALPTIQKELKLEPAQLQWIMSAYPLSSGCLFLVMGRVADLYGRKRTFLFGSSLLAIFTLCCAFPTDVLPLDVLRGLSGIGGAAMIPASLGILANSFPPSHARSLAFATFSAGAPVGAVFGTAVGGVLTEFTHKTWRSSFYLFSGLTVLCFIGGLLSIDKDLPSNEKDRRIDWIGAFLVTGGLVLIVFVLSQGEIASDKWATPYIIALLIVGVLLLAMFLYWQHYLETVQNNPDAPYSRLTPPPLMKLSIWTRANGRFAAMMAIAFTNWCAFLAWTFWVQLYYQNYMGYSAMDTVVRLLPMFVSGMACNLFVGLMAAHVPIVWLVGTGAAATAIACLLFAISDPKTTYWAYAFNASYISVMGADFVFSSGTLFIAKFALPHEQSVAGALFNTMTQLGTAVGVTVTTVVYNSVGKSIASNEDNIATYRAAQWTAFAFGVIATTLGVVFFRGVGVVGHRNQKPTPDSPMKAEEGKNSMSKELPTTTREVTSSERIQLTDASSSVPSQFFNNTTASASVTATESASITPSLRMLSEQNAKATTTGVQVHPEPEPEAHDEIQSRPERSNLTS